MNPLHRLNLILLLGLLLFITCAGCISKSTQDESTATTVKPEQIDHPGAIYEDGDAAYPDGYYIHTVTLPDESISIIAKWFTGDLKNWEMLSQCNPDINPNRIFLGNKIKIPRIMMTKHTAMTREFVEESQPQPKRKKVKSSSGTKTTPAEPDKPSPVDQTTPEPAADEEPLLFGPKGYSTN